MDEKNLTADAAKVNPLVVASVIGLIILSIGYVVYRIRKRGVGDEKRNLFYIYFFIVLSFTYNSIRKK